MSWINVSYNSPKYHIEDIQFSKRIKCSENTGIWMQTAKLRLNITNVLNLFLARRCCLSRIKKAMGNKDEFIISSGQKLVLSYKDEKSDSIKLMPQEWQDGKDLKYVPILLRCKLKEMVEQHIYTGELATRSAWESNADNITKNVLCCKTWLSSCNDYIKHVRELVLNIANAFKQKLNMPDIDINILSEDMADKNTLMILCMHVGN